MLTCNCGRSVHHFLSCGPDLPAVQESELSEYERGRLTAASECAEIADRMPHRKGFSIADEIRDRFGLAIPKDRPIDGASIADVTSRSST